MSVYPLINTAYISNVTINDTLVADACTEHSPSWQVNGYRPTGQEIHRLSHF
jgi:hypothetical protein